MAAWTTNVFTVAKLLPLLLLIALGLPQVRIDVPRAHAVEHPDWREAVLLMVFAYGGFESMVIAASETRDPRRDTGPALIAAGAIVTLIYCLLQLVIVGVLPDAGRNDDADSVGVARDSRSGRCHPREHRGHPLRLRMADRLHADDAPRALLNGQTTRPPEHSGPRAPPLSHAARGDRRECHPRAGHGAL